MLDCAPHIHDNQAQSPWIHDAWRYLYAYVCRALGTSIVATGDYLHRAYIYYVGCVSDDRDRARQHAAIYGACHARPLTIFTE